MSLIYKEQKDIQYKVNITQNDGTIYFFFSSDCGKHGMSEIIDEHILTTLELLEILQKNIKDESNSKIN